MNVSPVSVAVIDKKTITKAEVLRAGKEGKAVKVQAIANGKYLLSQGNDGMAPENITVRRSGKNLLVMLEGREGSEPDLIIEDFFDKSGTLIGKAEDGNMHAYVSTDGDAEHEAAALEDGETAALALSEGVADSDSGYVLASGFEWSPALIALGGLAAIAAAAGLGYLAAKEQYQDDHHSNSSGSEGGAGGGSGGEGGDAGGGEGSGGAGGGDVKKPTISGMTDNVGDVTGPVTNGGRTDDTTPTFAGTGTPGNTIEVWDGESKIGEAKVNADGSWSFTPQKALTSGKHSIVTKERNDSGIVSEPSEKWEFTVDLTAPARGTIGSMVDDSVSPALPIEKNGITKDNTPTLAGKAEANSTVQVWDNGNLLGTAKTDKDGNWRFTPTKLEDGKHDISVIVVDEVGNKSLPSEAFIVEVDTVAPENSGIGKITDSNGDPINDGSTTQEPRPTMEGTGEDGETVLIIDNGQIIGSVVVEGGTWTYTPDKDLDSGRHELETVVRDQAGNESAPSDKIVIDLDTGVNPVDPGEELPDPAVPVAGTIGTIFKDNNPGGIPVPVDNNASNDESILITGTGVPGDVILLYMVGVNHSYVFSATVGEDGKWEYSTPDLPDDVYDMRGVFQRDGEIIGKTDVSVIEIDTIPPEIPDVGISSIIEELSVIDLLAIEENTLFAEEKGAEENSEIDHARLSDMVFEEVTPALSANGVAVHENISEADLSLHYTTQDI